MSTRTPPRPSSAPSPPQAPPIPPLETGDHLTRPEFERRYNAMPDLKKAELIEGVVYMPSPVRHVQHGHLHFNVITWLGTYCMATPGVEGGDNGSLRLDLDNMPQPDAYLLIRPDRGGRARIGPDGYIEGGPELVAEEAASSASHDLHTKLQVYRRNGVQEYLAWRVQDQAFDWFTLREGHYEPLSAGPDGFFRSEVLPGLWLDPVGLSRGDLSAVARAVQQGLATPEHVAFVARLGQAPAGGAGR